MLEIQHLTKYYGKIRGVEDLSLRLAAGEVFGFIGPNGAGKSTTIRCIMNLVSKTQGKVLVNREEFNKDDTTIKAKIGYLPSEVRLYDDLTVHEMLDYHASFYPQNLNKRRRKLVELFALDESKKIEDLSLGNTKKLGIILAFMHNPKLLILDEPTSGLDPIMQQKFYNLIREEKQKGTTIFYSTHILSEISRVCDRVGIIKNGRLLEVETVDELHQKGLNYITLESPAIDRIIARLGLKDYERDANQIKFRDNISPNELIKTLSEFDITKILIEEVTLEEVFLHYYK